MSLPLPLPPVWAGRPARLATRRLLLRWLTAEHVADLVPLFTTTTTASATASDAATATASDADADADADARSDPGPQPDADPQPGPDRQPDPGQLRGRIGHAAVFVLTGRTHPAALGLVTLGPAGGADVQVDVRVLPAHRGQGLALEAASAVMDWVISELGPARLVAQVPVDDEAAARLCRSLGFRPVDAPHAGTVRHQRLP